MLLCAVPNREPGARYLAFCAWDRDLRRNLQMLHLLAQFPAHALNAILLGSQTVYCLITGSIPVLGGVVVRAERPGYYSLVITLMTSGFGLQLFGVHF